MAELIINKTSEISSDIRDRASVRAASRHVGETNNSFTCVVADSGITSYDINHQPHTVSDKITRCTMHK